MDKWEPAYIGNRRTKIFSHKKFGIYLIRKKISREIKYIGMSRFSIYKALYRHFNKWNDVPQRVVYFNKFDYEVRGIIIPYEDVCRYEQRLIRYFKPCDNHEFYDDIECSVNDFIPEPELEEVPF